MTKTTSLLDFFQSVSAACSLDDFRLRAIVALRRLVPCDIASHVELRPGGWARALVEPSEVLFPEGEEILVRHALDDPVVDHFLRTPDHQVLKTSDFLTRQELHRRELYQQLYRRIGAEYQIAFAFPSRQSDRAGIALSRTLHDFDERDRRLLQLARPHLVQTRANAARLDQLHAAIEHGEQALIALGPSGEIRHATRQAECLLETYLEPAGSSGRLPAALGDWAERERARLTVDDKLPAPASLFVARRDGRRLVARFLPGEASAVDLLLLAEEVGEGGAEMPHLGLSPREVEVLRLVARGLTDAQIAAALVVSPRTIHKHLEHIYEKLGVRTRTAAVSRLLGQARIGPRDLGRAAA